MDFTQLQEHLDFIALRATGFSAAPRAALPLPPFADQTPPFAIAE